MQVLCYPRRILFYAKTDSYAVGKTGSACDCEVFSPLIAKDIP
jgi:hypothetical protein